MKSIESYIVRKLENAAESLKEFNSSGRADTMIRGLIFAGIVSIAFWHLVFWLFDINITGENQNATPVQRNSNKIHDPGTSHRNNFQRSLYE